MKYQRKLKDKKAQVFKPMIVHDSRGYELTDWQPITDLPLWCYAQTLSGKINDGNIAIHVDEDKLFVFNFRNDIKPEFRILYRDSWFQITRCNSFADYQGGELFVYAKRLGDH